MKRLGILLGGFAMAAIVAGGLMGCNTVKGVGKDIQRGGQAIQGVASD